MSADRAEAFLRDWGRALHTYGVPAHRLESALYELSAKLDVEAQYLSTPTSLTCAFGPPGEQRMSLARLSPGNVDLGRLVGLDALGQDVLAGKLDAEGGLARLYALLSAPRPFGPVATLVAFAALSAAAARFLGGGLIDVAASLLTGLAVGVLAVFARAPTHGRVLAPLGGLVAAVGGALAAHQGASGTVVTLAGVLVLLPGFTLTVAMNELGTGNLVSGTARLAGGVATLLQLTFGIYTGQVLASGIQPLARAGRVALPELVDLGAIVVMALALVVQMQARWRDAGWVALGTVVAWASTRLTSQHSAELTPFLGAVAVTAVANLAARLARKPATLVAVPGLLVLVPGSVGLRGMTLMHDDAVKGLELLFQTGFVAVGLVAGLLVAHVLVPPRRSL